MPRPTPLIVAGSSARYLAQSAKRVGADVYAVDAFGDTDTREGLSGFVRADGCRAHDLYEAVKRLIDQYQLVAPRLVYTAGFEHCPSVLADLEALTRLQGNRVEVLHLLSDSARWLALLDRLQILHPETRDQAPVITDSWLYKAPAGFGGLGVRCAQQDGPDFDGGYYQRYVAGDVYSVTFAAIRSGSASKVSILGFNQSLAVSPEAGDFRYAGAVSQACLSDVQKDRVKDYIQRLANALRLQGINGLDFVLQQTQPSVLELNARPTAALELYDAQLAEGGLDAHLRACQGELPVVLVNDQVHAKRVVYSAVQTRIGQLSWPGWTSDRPIVGTRIDAAQPLCCVHAQAGDRDTAKKLAQTRSEDIRMQIDQSIQDAA